MEPLEPTLDPPLQTRMTQAKFEPYSQGDDIEDYLERVELFLTVKSEKTTNCFN